MVFLEYGVRALKRELVLRCRWNNSLTAGNQGLKGCYNESQEIGGDEQGFDAPRTRKVSTKPSPGWSGSAVQDDIKG